VKLFGCLSLFVSFFLYLILWSPRTITIHTGSIETP
jgi:hypothetical protein